MSNEKLDENLFTNPEIVTNSDDVIMRDDKRLAKLIFRHIYWYIIVGILYGIYMLIIFLKDNSENVQGEIIAPIYEKDLKNYFKTKDFTQYFLIIIVFIILIFIVIGQLFKTKKK